jgi:DNA-binding NarL/FixJ family response regulator
VQWLGDDGNRCDLMIVDVFLAQGSGLGVLRAAHRRKQPGKLVVLSNYATADIRRKCLELGADRVFDKSNEIEALIAYCLRLSTGDSGVSSAFSVLS